MVLLSRRSHVFKQFLTYFLCFFFFVVAFPAESIDAISTISVAKRWKKKLRHVRSKIKKKKQETDSMSAAHITHQWKSETERSKELGCSSEAGERRRSVGRRRKKSEAGGGKESSQEGATLSETAATINVTRKWKDKMLKKPIEEGEED